MNKQTKRDIGAGVATALMLLGASIAPGSVLGFGLIATGVVTWIALFGIQLGAKP